MSLTTNGGYLKRLYDVGSEASLGSEEFLLNVGTVVAFKGDTGENGADGVDGLDMGQPFICVNNPSIYHFPQVFSSLSSIIASVNTLYIIPITITRELQVTRLGIRVASASGGNSCRVGIYSPGQNGFPLNLIADSGNLSAGSSGDKEGVVQVQLPVGIYWLAVHSQGNPGLGAGTVASLANGAASSISYIRGWTVSIPYGELPPSLSNISWTPAISGAFPAPWIRAV